MGKKPARKSTKHRQDPPKPVGDLLTPAQAGALLSLSPRTLEGMRHRGGGPKFAKLGEGQSARILYPRAEIDAWIAANLRPLTRG